MIWTQTKALLVDAYRELNARKLFWITMALSGVVVILMAALGINEKGVTFLVWTFDFIPITSDTLKPEVFYKSLFSSLGIGIWLTWAAAILALISTAGVIPDLVSGGAIETVLSKPISRVRLFLTKYLMGLLFVALQVLVFCLGSFLVFGLRADLWEPGIFLAIPIVVVFFSYLFCICALVGLITRSTITSLLVTLLFWFVLFIVNTGDGILMQFRVMNEMQLSMEQRRAELMEKNTARLLTRQREEAGEPVEGWTPTREEILAANPFLPTNLSRIDSIEETLEELAFWSNLVIGIKTALPKTSETIALLERHLIDLSDLPGADSEDAPFDLDDDAVDVDQEQLGRELQARFRERSVAWILVTSLAFEGVVLLIGCVVFARRDF